MFGCDKKMWHLWLFLSMDGLLFQRCRTLGLIQLVFCSFSPCLLGGYQPFIWLIRCHLSFFFPLEKKVFIVKCYASGLGRYSFLLPPSVLLQECSIMTWKQCRNNCSQEGASCVRVLCWKVTCKLYWLGRAFMWLCPQYHLLYWSC